MKDSVIIEGKIYISSRRAAEIHKYSNDYIGQLCRAEKVNAKMVGRTWFIDEDSLRNHKNVVEESFRVRAEILARNLKQNNSATTHISTGAVASVYFPQNPSILQGLSTKEFETLSLSSARNIWKFTSVLAVIILLFGVYTVSHSSALKNQISANSSSVASIIYIPESIINYIVHSFQNISRAVSSRLAHRSNPSEIYSLADSSGALSTHQPQDWNGIAVSPAAGSEAENEMIKQKIRDSFSENVSVNPDRSGTAGVITPVFKDAKDTGFIYVLVPVKDKENKNKKDILPP